MRCLSKCKEVGLERWVNRNFYIVGCFLWSQCSTLIIFIHDHFITFTIVTMVMNPPLSSSFGTLSKPRNNHYATLTMEKKKCGIQSEWALTHEAVRPANVQLILCWRLHGTPLQFCWNDNAALLRGYIPGVRILLASDKPSWFMIHI